MNVCGISSFYIYMSITIDSERPATYDPKMQHTIKYCCLHYRIGTYTKRDLHSVSNLLYNRCSGGAGAEKKIILIFSRFCWRCEQLNRKKIQFQVLVIYFSFQRKMNDWSQNMASITEMTYRLCALQQMRWGFMHSLNMRETNTVCKIRIRCKFYCDIKITTNKKVFSCHS